MLAASRFLLGTRTTALARLLPFHISMEDRYPVHAYIEGRQHTQDGMDHMGRVRPVKIGLVVPRGIVADPGGAERRGS